MEEVLAIVDMAVEEDFELKVSIYTRLNYTIMKRKFVVAGT